MREPSGDARAQFLGAVRGALSVFAFDPDCDEPREGRIGQGPTPLELRLRKSVEVMAEQPTHWLGIWIVGLHHHAAGIAAPTGAPADLGQQVERPLRSPKVR